MRFKVGDIIKVINLNYTEIPSNEVTLEKALRDTAKFSDEFPDKIYARVVRISNKKYYIDFINLNIKNNWFVYAYEEEIDLINEEEASEVMVYIL